MTAHDVVFKDRLERLTEKTTTNIGIQAYQRTKACSKNQDNTSLAQLERWINASQVHNTQRRCPMLNGKIAPRGPASQPWGSLGLRWRPDPLVEVGWLDGFPTFDQIHTHMDTDTYVSNPRSSKGIKYKRVFKHGKKANTCTGV